MVLMGRTSLSVSLISVVACVAGLTGCVDTNDDDARDDEWGMEGSVEPTPPPGKEDSENRRGILVATNTSRTQVWTARNKWEEYDTVAARKAGPAWGESSGLTWV
jgi:hypothetical protein